MTNLNKNSSSINFLVIINLIFCMILYSQKIFSEEVEDSKKVENYLYNLSPVEIFFSQISEKNIKEKGWMLLSGEEKARVEFAPPNNMVIVANGKWFMIHDPVSFKTSYLPINFGPFKSLINPREFFSNSNFDIKYKYQSDKIFMSIDFKDDKGNNIPVHLDMYFNKSPIKLIGWKVTDIQKKITTVKIDKIKKHIVNSKEESLFKLTEEMRRIGDVFRGPWKRDPIQPKIRSGRGGS